MDQGTLVANQIADGQKLVGQLIHDGFPVAAAGWIRACEDGQWFLYVASPTVDSGGHVPAYRRVHTVIRQLPQPFSIHPFDVKLIATADPVAKAMLAVRDTNGVSAPTWFRGDHLGPLAVEEAYIYPPLTFPGSAGARSGVA
jgi:hypothetical protein